MSRLGSLALVVLVLGGFALYVFDTEPRWYERLRYPLRYEQIVTGHAENYHLDPQLVAAPRESPTAPAATAGTNPISSTPS